MLTPETLAFSLLARSRPFINRDNAAPVVQILAWLLLTFSILSVAAELATKLAMSKPLALPDFLLLTALTLGVGHIAAIVSPAGQHIGGSTAGLGTGEVHNTLRALYAADILTIPTLLLTKASLLAAFHIITPFFHHRATIYTTSVLTAAWAVSAIFIIAFQCAPPERWDVMKERISGNCIDIPAARTYVAAMNIATDILLIFIPSMIVLSVQMTWSKRLTILGGFWFRLLVIPATVLQIFYIQRLKFDSRFIHAVWPVVVCTEIVQALSIITACIPFLKPFLMSLESGFLRADDEQRRTEAGLYGSGGKSKPSGWSSRYIKLRNQQIQNKSVSTEGSRSIHVETAVSNQYELRSIQEER